MKKHKRYTVGFRRKREGKTNYRRRLKLVKGRKLRLVVRPSSKNIVVQLVEYNEAGDRVIVSAHSKEIVKMGWKANCGNLPTAYLVGLLVGKKSAAKGLKDAVLDIGMGSPVNSSRYFAALKGAVDAGLDIRHSEEVLPSDDRISGKHIADYAKQLVKEKEVYNKRFSSYLKKNLKPEELEKHFKDIKVKVEGKK
ncbi:50S ribosomal protein L18 [Candidatus Woesearchaeota archaeon]|nr:50S ribosomal protein L18 [Candidatus Woesearchaeota archaeon]